MTQSEDIRPVTRMLDALHLNSLHIRLAILTAITLVSSIFFYSVYVASDQSAFAAKVIEQQAVVLAQNIGATATEHLITTDLSALEQLILGSARFPGVRSIQISDESGRVLSSVKRVGDEEPSVVFERKRKVLAVPQELATHTHFYADYMEVWYPVVNKSLLGWVRIESSLESIARVQRHIWRQSAIAAMGAALISIAILLLFLTSPMRSLRKATAFAEQLDQQRGREVQLDSGIAEIARLEDALNLASRRLYLQEHDLEESSERLGSIVNNIIESIITIDVQGKIESFNPAAEKIFGYAREEVIGTNIRFLMPEPYSSSHDEYLRRYCAAGELNAIGARRELIGLRKDESQFPMELGVSLIRRNDAVWFTVVVRDLTEIKRVEQMKSEFVSTVSHELRTPLTSIRGSLSLVAAGVAGKLPEKAQEMINIGLSNCDRLMHLINDILDIGKIESGKMEFQLEPLSIVQLLSKAIEDNRIYAEHYGVQFVLESDLPDDVLIYGDAQRLAQVVANLLSNAAKFSKVGDTVTISVTATDSVIRVAVVDLGVGIPDEFRGRIFQKFAQADSSDSRQKGGTGLGLHICKVIIEKHAGRMEFDSEPGKGSRFYFELHRAMLKLASEPNSHR